MKRKNIIFILYSLSALLALAGGVSSAMADGSNVSRSLSSNLINSGEFISVDLGIALNGGQDFYLIDEVIPQNFIITALGGGNDLEPGHIKWINLQAPSTELITYIIQAPSPVHTTVYSFNGIYTLDGMNVSSQIEEENSIIVNIVGESASSSSSSSGGSSGGSSSSGNSNLQKGLDEGTIIENKEKARIDFKILKAVKSSKNQVKITYSIQEISGFDRDVNLWILLLDPGNKVIAEIHEYKKISANSKQEFESFLDTKSLLKGQLKLLVDIDSEQYSELVQGDIVLKSPATGFSIFKDEDGESDPLLLAIILIIFGLVLAIFLVLIRNILRDRADLNETMEIEETSKKVSRKKK